MPHEVHVLQEQVHAREAKIMELEREAVLLNEEKQMLQVEVHFTWFEPLTDSHKNYQSKAPSYEQLSQYSFFKAILDYISYQEVIIADKAEENRRLTEEISQMQVQLTARAELYSSSKV